MRHASGITFFFISARPSAAGIHPRVVQRGVGDQLQLVVTGEALDGLWWLIELRHAALAGYLRDVSERITSASRQSAYPARIVTGGTDAEGC